MLLHMAMSARRASPGGHEGTEPEPGVPGVLSPVVPYITGRGSREPIQVVVQYLTLTFTPLILSRAPS